MSLNDLPLETLEHIVHYIDDTKDLLYFALINKQFAKLVIQRHLQFRIIRCLTNTKFIWSKLADRPQLCGRIRELHLYGGDVFDFVMNLAYPRNAILPASFLGNDSDIKLLWPCVRGVEWVRSIEERLIPSAAAHSASSRSKSSVEICSVEQSLAFFSSVILPLVANLTKVSLLFPFCTHPTSQALKAVLDNLKCFCCRLQEISITWDPCEEEPEHVLKDDILSSLWKFSDLTVFHFKMFPGLGNHDVDELLHLIVDRCPNLEKLFLNFRTLDNTMNLDEIWKRGNWKHLHHLYLGYYMTPMDTEAGNLFKRFMAHHPGIECLEYPGPNNISRLSHLLETNNIRALKLSDILMAVGPPPSQNSQIAPALQGRMFEKVECLCIGASFTGELLEKTYGPSLRILIIESYVSNHKGGLVHYFPDTLERLCIRWRTHIVAGNLIEALSPLHKLTHLCISLDPGFYIPPPEMLLPEISRLSSLKYFGLICKGSSAESWVRLIRDTSGKYASYEKDTSVNSVIKWWNFSYI